MKGDMGEIYIYVYIFGLDKDCIGAMYRSYRCCIGVVFGLCRDGPSLCGSVKIRQGLVLHYLRRISNRVLKNHHLDRLRAEVISTHASNALPHNVKPAYPASGDFQPRNTTEER